MKKKRGAGTLWFWMFALLALAMYQLIVIFGGGSAQQKNDGWYSLAQPDEGANMLQPRQLYITLGGEEGSYGRLTVQDEGFETVFERTYGLLEYVLQEGKTAEGSFAELPWEKEACVLVYEFAIGSDLLAQQVGLEEELVPEGSWSEIWVVPARSGEEKAMVYLLDRSALCYVEFECKGWKQEENQQFLEVLQQEGSVLKKTYFAALKAWPEQSGLGKYVLEQSAHESGMDAEVKSPFLAGAKLVTEQAESYAKRFFEYPDTVTVQRTRRRVLVNNEKITVRIDENGRVQYVETLTDSEKQPVNMAEAYQLAVGFVKADLQWDAEAAMNFYFADYQAEENGYVFYFNYMIDGIPFQMTEETAEELQMEYPIQVTVEGSKVRRYERYVLELEAGSENGYTLTATWQEALDAMAEKGEMPETIPQLKYYVEANRVVLYWEAETGEETVKIRAQ